MLAYVSLIIFEMALVRIGVSGGKRIDIKWICNVYLGFLYCLHKMQNSKMQTERQKNGEKVQSVFITKCCNKYYVTF